MQFLRFSLKKKKKIADFLELSSKIGINVSICRKIAERLKSLHPTVLSASCSASLLYRLHPDLPPCGAKKC